MTKTLHELTRAQQRKAEQTGGACIGSLLWWSLAENHITQEALQALAEQHKLPETYLPAPNKPTTAFRRAWRYVARHLKDNLLLREITESTDGIVVGLVQESANSQMEVLDYNHMVTISFGKKTGLIGANKEHFVVEEIREQYQHFLLHTTQDIRAMLLSFVADTAVSLRDRGGVYFIPAPSHDLLQSMVHTIEGIGSNQLHQLPLYDSPQTQDVLGAVTIKTLDEELKQLDVELHTFMDNDSTRRSTLLKRIDVFDKLRSRVSTFSGVLTVQADDLQRKVNQLQEELLQHLQHDKASQTQKKSKETNTESQETKPPSDSPPPDTHNNPDTHKSEVLKPWDEPLLTDDPSKDPFFVYDACDPDAGF